MANANELVLERENRIILLIGIFSNDLSLDSLFNVKGMLTDEYFFCKMLIFG
jgi:hypothetical protein